jgi:hypothetical protein
MMIPPHKSRDYKVQDPSQAPVLWGQDCTQAPLKCCLRHHESHRIECQLHLAAWTPPPRNTRPPLPLQPSVQRSQALPLKTSSPHLPTFRGLNRLSNRLHSAYRRIREHRTLSGSLADAQRRNCAPLFGCSLGDASDGSHTPFEDGAGWSEPEASKASPPPPEVAISCDIL